MNEWSAHREDSAKADPLSPASRQKDYGAILNELQIMVGEARDEGVNLAEFFGRLEAAGFALVSLVLAMPFLQPLPLGPLGTVVGISLLALGLQMRRGRKLPLLPRKLLHANVKGKAIAWALRVNVRILTFCRKFTRPRLSHLVTGEKGRRLCGTIIAAGGLLMSAPFIAIPFNNMLPALAVFFAALAEIEGDGVMVWVAIAWLAVTLLFFAAVLTVVVLLGVEALQWFHTAPKW